MKDIELVIKIPQKWFDNMVREEFSEVDELCAIIQHGVVLPEDHGRLGDLDALEEEMLGGINAGLMIDGYEDYPHINDTEDCLECVKYADTIIKASHPTRAKGRDTGVRYGFAVEIYRKNGECLEFDQQVDVFDGYDDAEVCVDRSPSLDDGYVYGILQIKYLDGEEVETDMMKVFDAHVEQDAEYER